MKKQWKRLAALSSALVMAAGTLLYVPTDTLQNISWGITASAEEDAMQDNTMRKSVQCAFQTAKLISSWSFRFFDHYCAERKIGITIVISKQCA